MQRLGLFLVVIFILGNVSAVCDSNQVDINSASAEELDTIVWVGSAMAQKIIDARPFDSLDDLKEVSGFGGTGARVEDIKSQGLACVDGDYEDDEKEDSSEDGEEYKNDKLNEKDSSIESKNNSEVVYFNEIESESVERGIISLGKDIKTEINNEVYIKKNYSWLYLIAFCFLLALLYIARERKKYGKSEFR
jgi:hypothetical protein